MKLVAKLAIVITLLSLLSTLTCGFWIQYSGETVTSDAINFHMGLGVFTAIVALITIVLLANQTR